MRSLLMLSLCLPALCFAEGYALRGALVTPDEVIENGVLVVEDGAITAVVQEAPAGMPVIDTDGLIVPGMIDLHNHVNWNAHPRWQAPHTHNRYEWQALGSYLTVLSDPHRAAMEKAGCDMQKFGEVKAIVWGVTTIAGGHSKNCDSALARNLDQAFGFGVADVQYQVFPLEQPEQSEAKLRAGLKNVPPVPVIAHVAEGIDASAKREFSMVKGHEYLTEGFVIVHGIALAEGEFRELGEKKVGLVWSPRSNIALYGQTADVATAKRNRVQIALAPDWSPSGSNGMLEELSYAAQWNTKQSSPPFSAKELVLMTTSVPAKLARVDHVVGRLAPGTRADYVVIPRGAKTDVYEALLSAGATEVALVSIDGRPVYGDRALMQRVNPKGRYEKVVICGVEKFLDTAGPDGAGPRFSDTRKKVAKTFGALKTPMADLAECPATESPAKAR